MYTEPSLLLNQGKLEKHLEGVIKRKEALLAACAVDKDILMSNPKFAELLQSLGVAPPMKISSTTLKLTFAFAKTDPGMKDLLEHPDERVQVLAAARMGVKSTLEETRTTRFIDIAKRGGFFPIPLKYSAARTHRLGGMDKINLQNLPARGKDAKRLKKAIEPPPGYIVINSDSSNIEARMLAWLAEQDDLVSDFANKVDVYSKMSSRIYNREIDRKRVEIVNGKETLPDEAEGFVGKTVVLGCGYQTGALKLQITLKAATPPMDMPLEECERIVKTYRSTYAKIPELWKLGDKAIQAMHDDKGMWLGKEGVLLVEGKKGIKLPNGLYISYPSLHQYDSSMNGRPMKKWRYKDEKGFQDIYGGKLIENVVQALARIIVMLQLLKIAKRYTVPLTVHDSVVAIAKETEAQEALAYIEECMRWIPKWAHGCPINCEAKIGANYGEC
jgi:DNA polymerase